jgi:hypothetical protein
MMLEIIFASIFCIAVFYAYVFLKKITAGE